MSVVSGLRPDITPAQIVGLLVAGVPVLANLLHAFGVYAVSADEQHALTETLQWGGVVAAALFVSDAGLRGARNVAAVQQQAAAAPAVVSDDPPPLNQPASEG